MAEPLKDLLRGKPVFVNVGVREFGDTLHAAGYEVVHVDWSPPAGGTRRWPLFWTICCDGDLRRPLGRAPPPPAGSYASERVRSCAQLCLNPSCAR